jgi:hypothetical protein
MLNFFGMKRENIELGCREVCHFRKPFGEHPCATANKGDVCIYASEELQNVYETDSVTVKGNGKKVEIYMDRTQKVGVLDNGIVTPQF